jgi:acetaldehyde dehydrogenase (acetylating)
MLQDQDLLSIQEVRTKVEKAYAAFQHYRRFSQEQVDAIVESMAAAGRAHAREFAELAVKETGYGNVKDKIAKNLLNADLLPRAIRDMKTVGVLREVPESKIIEVGVPVGVVAAILPTTNPTSTAIYKIIISLKAGNSIVISPHPRAKECTCYTAEVLYKAAREAGAPEDIIQCIRHATIDGTNALMRHPRTGVILSTGGSGIVRAAYSSGKPAFGVGPGNVPVLIDDTADLREAVAKIVEGKSFDYGTVCSSEQSIVALKSRRDAILEELRKNRAHLCTKEQGEALATLLITRNWTINPDCVGQAPAKIAEMAGFSVPAETSILAVEIGGVGKQHPLSMEKLSPVLSMLFVEDWEEQIRTCQAILKFGGLGHTCVIYSKDDARIREFGIRMPAFRVLVNTPAPQGSTGITTGVLPSMTLGCGAMAGNITSDNIGPLHLINIKRIAYVVREAGEAFTDENQSATPPRAVISEAVSRYLAQRGLRRPPSATVPETSSAGIVDRFLRSRATPVTPPATCDSRPERETPVASPAPPAPPSPSAPPAPDVRISDFVCEADVRSALHQGKKIFIGPKTIITPAARELAASHDILVQAQR